MIPVSHIEGSDKRPSVAQAPRGAANRNLYYPCCYRDGSEIRPRTAFIGAASETRRGAAQ